MQIHELTTKQLNEASTIGSALGLNNPVVAQAWNAMLGQAAEHWAAKRTKDPRYANLPLEQRIDAMKRDAAVTATAQQLADAWKQTLYGLMYRNNNQPLSPEQYKTNFQSFIEKNLFNDRLEQYAPEVKKKVEDASVFVGQNQREANSVGMAIQELAALAATSPITRTGKQAYPPIVIGDQTFINKGQGYVDSKTGMAMDPALLKLLTGQP